MARRETPEINAGSMADIAFLLLVFFLMVTTIESESGILRQLPPIPEDIENPPDVKEKDVFVVLVNMNDELLVESKRMDINDLKDAAKEFLVANGIFGNRPPLDNFPERKKISKTEIEKKYQDEKARLASIEANSSSTPDQIKAANKAVEKYRKKLVSIKLFGKEFNELPGSALISMQTNNNTTYNRYLQVQNELQAAIGELRDELAKEYFGKTYKELNEEYEKNRNNDEVAGPIKDKLYAIQAIYPSRISEAEPLDIQKY